MLIRCKKVADGPGPHEAVVEVSVAGGTEEVVVPMDRLHENGRAMDIGRILGTKAGYALIELPRESTTGRWRLWVPETEVDQAA